MEFKQEEKQDKIKVDGEVWRMINCNTESYGASFDVIAVVHGIVYELDEDGAIVDWDYGFKNKEHLSDLWLSKPIVANFFDLKTSPKGPEVIGQSTVLDGLVIIPE